VMRHLSQVGFQRAPAVAAVVDYTRQGDARSSMAIIQQAVEVQADGWTHATEWLGRFFDHAAAREFPEAPSPGSLLELAATAAPPSVQEHLSAYLEVAASLGRRSAEMHRALAAASDDAGFAPEPFTSEDGATAQRRGLTLAERTLRGLEIALDAGRIRPSEDVAGRIRTLLDRRDALLSALGSDLSGLGASVKIRIHGDYRLAQVLLAEGDFYIQSFEGHLAWPAAALREKQSPLRDVASMLRSFSYASHAALTTRTSATADERATLESWAHLWETWSTAVFLQQYFSLMDEPGALPAATAERDQLLRFFMLDRALRELDGELNNRPDWVGIPVVGILELLKLG
jgi:maltose alpha-D-glucosyltransferase / alpha-amylase